MSIDINWESLTSGPDGAVFAETVRDFIHERFQQVTLPRFIRSVHVHSFDFGTIPPELELKDVCDPLPDFYEDDDDDEDDDGDGGADEQLESADAASEDFAGRANPQRSHPLNTVPTTTATRPPYGQNRNPPRLETQIQPSAYSHLYSSASPDPTSGRRSSTPGIPGGTSNLSSFHLPLSAGISGASTPLAAFGGPHFGSAAPGAAAADHHAFLAKQNGERFVPGSRNAPPQQQYPGTSTPGMLGAGTGVHPLRLHSALRNTNTSTTSGPPGIGTPSHAAETPLPPTGSPPALLSSPSGTTSPAPNDVQIVLRATYTGDILLVLTADILLDYPMQAFVGIPLQLTVTGLRFDGVAILAYIRQKACFCFLSPEDADALVGQDNGREPGERADDDGVSPVDQKSSTKVDQAAEDADAPPGVEEQKQRDRKRIGNLLEDMRIESEIGEKGAGKQVLKNVGKVEKFVLERVRKIFEEEFVYPSFWTFLV